MGSGRGCASCCRKCWKWTKDQWTVYNLDPYIVPSKEDCCCCLKPVFIFSFIISLAFYVGFIQMWYSEVHLTKDPAYGVTTTKVYGGVHINKLSSDYIGDGIWDGVWDDSDYVEPPKMNNAFFISTNIHIADDQVQGICPESSKVLDALCTNDTDCPNGIPVAYGNGVRTGRCVPAADADNVTVCEVHAWCPVLHINQSSEGVAPLDGTRLSRVYIQSHVNFPGFKLEWSNVENTDDETYLSRCVYVQNDPETHRCPNFIIGDMVDMAGYSYSDIALKGGVIEITINWDCHVGIIESTRLMQENLETCIPNYSFQRLGTRNRKAGLGHFYRYIRNYGQTQDGVNTRDLIQTHGILFTISISGKAKVVSIGKVIIIFTVFPFTTFFCVWDKLVGSSCCRRCCGKHCGLCLNRPPDDVPTIELD